MPENRVKKNCEDEGMVDLRDSYGQALLELGEENPDIMVFTADIATSTKTSVFGKRFPDRFVDVGIAEQNMITMAAGVAACGKVPFVSTLAVFAVERALNQLSVSVAYPKLNVKVVATHGGVSVGKDGATHQSIMDVAITRAIPNMTVIVPCDGTEAHKCIKAVAYIVGPAYVRLGREPVPLIFDGSYKFRIGRAEVLRDGGDASIICNGLMVHEAIKAHEKLRSLGVSARVIDMHTVKPLDEKAIVRAARETGAIVTAEEHSVLGGTGGAVAETVVENYPVPLIRVGLKDTFGESGEPRDLLAKYGLLEVNIVEAVGRAIKMKK